MEAVLEKRKISYVSPVQPISRVEKVLTYEIIQQRKREQQRLIDAGIIEKPKLILGFTPEERKAFDNGHTVEEVFDRIAQKYGF